MNILIFSPGYPDSRKSEYPFVKQLVDEWAKQGNTCTVIAPYSITRNKRFCKYKSIERFKEGGSVTIIRPNILTFSNFKIFGISLTAIFNEFAAKRAIKIIKQSQDFVYCHFWQSGIVGNYYATSHNVPLIIATGESNVKKLTHNVNTNFVNNVLGVVAVSSKNKDESISLRLTSEEKCKVFPNAVDTQLFKKIDKIECRRKMGVALDAYVVVFVGSFKESKGPNRVSDAIKMISGQPVYSIFIGSGDILPTAPNILFTGRLLHKDIPYYLNAADVFVLPTLAEGCCNAIVEAMACGLPIISSNLPFNWDILNEKNSIMIDPLNVHEIANAITILRDNPDKRKIMSQASLDTAKDLKIENRAKNIISFIKERIEKEHLKKLYLQS